MTNKKKARIRTIHNAILEIKKFDPETDFTECALRELIKNGTIPSVPIGNRNLVNIDLLFDYLSFSCYNVEDEYTVSTTSLEV